ncbi:FeoA family protein [Collimonas pratensis]|uniref:FeoA family protein n=1 Tax=Collimonas pratensis TaxID=279113 RepID=UPI000783784E|nr:FeoA family protein [Collimonas pratensis]NKI70567.1 ferrous iron transport protein A [Collimonas pratensis]
MRLCDLIPFTPAVIEHVEDVLTADPIAQRLRELGFVNGEAVSVVARGPVGADPLMIQIGFTRFALRRAEAHRVHVNINLAS